MRSTNHIKAATLLPIYLPWLLSVCLQQLPELSYLVAWLGSFFIFYFTLYAPGLTLNPHLPWQQQLMTPIVLIQLIFTGFMCCSSIFYFLNHHDYYFFSQTDDRTDPPQEQIYRIAECQRLCLLAHCALVSGICSVSQTSRRSIYLLTISTDLLLIGINVISFVFAYILAYFPGTLQVSLMLSNLHLFSGTFLLVRGIKQKRFFTIGLGACTFLFSLGTHLFTGYKESIIVHFILLGCLIYPLYPKIVQTIIIPLALVFFILLPSFTKSIRQLAWVEHRKLSGIQQIAYFSLLDRQSEKLADNNWEFLTSRLSEIGMFTQFIKKVPDGHPYYGWEILQNAIQALVPRALWASKPNTEKVAMKRVYELGVANPESNVSAKCRPVVDGYLSAGPAGVFAAIFIYGFLAQLVCNTANRWFGETIGCIVIFNGLFQQLWRGNNFEFILNNIVYGTLLMTSIFCLLRIFRIIVLQPLKTKYDHPHQSVL